MAMSREQMRDVEQRESRQLSTEATDLLVWFSAELKLLSSPW